MNNMNKRYILIDIKTYHDNCIYAFVLSSIPVTWTILVLQVTALSVRAAVELDHLHNLCVKTGSKYPCAVKAC